MKKEYLNEERYQEINNKIKTKGTKIYNILLCIGIALVFLGIGAIIVNNTNNKNKELEIQRNKEEKQQALDAEVENLKRELTIIKDNLINKKQELLNKGLTPSLDYNDGETYDLYIINKVLDPSFPHCHFDDYKKNELTANYCTLTNIIDDYEIICEDDEITKKYCSIRTELYSIKDYESRNNSAIIGLSGASIVFGVMMVIYSLLSRLGLYLLTHRREIVAYQAQQVMPIAQEGFEKMAPTLGKVGKEMAKDVAPIYGDIAREIVKGVREAKEDKIKCQHCDELIDKDSTYCESCGKKI